MKSSKLQENKVRIGLANGKTTFPENWESMDRVLDKKIETGGYLRNDTSPELILELKRKWDEFFKNYTCPDF